MLRLLLSPALANDPKHQKYVERFVDEARAVNLIDHPGVLKIFDLGELPDKSMYILMEYLDGQTLQARIDNYQLDGKRLSPRKVFQMVPSSPVRCRKRTSGGDPPRLENQKTSFWCRIPTSRARSAPSCSTLGSRAFWIRPSGARRRARRWERRRTCRPSSAWGLIQLTGAPTFIRWGFCCISCWPGPRRSSVTWESDARALWRAAAPLGRGHHHVSPKVADFVMSLILKDPNQRMQMRQVVTTLQSFLDSGELSKRNFCGWYASPGVDGGTDNSGAGPDCAHQRSGKQAATARRAGRHHGRCCSGGASSPDSSPVG